MFSMQNKKLEKAITAPIEKPIKHNKAKTYSEPYLSNNQKAALFLLFPIGGVVWLGSYSIISNRNKIKKSIKIERESKVVFN